MSVGIKKDLELVLTKGNTIVKDDFILFLEFENGEKWEFDCKTLFDKKPFQVLKDEHFFKQAKNAFGTVVWSDEINIVQ